MKLQKITLEDFDEVRAILQATFPKEELQPQDRHYQIFQRHDFYGRALKENGKITALLLGYTHPEFLFLEFFAVDQSLRGHGLGQKILTEILHASSLPVILEVEPPETEIAQRRIGFYQRCGFHLNDYPYRLPVLGEGYGGCPLIVMSYPEAIRAEAFPRLKEQLYHDIYGV